MKRYFVIYWVPQDGIMYGESIPLVFAAESEEQAERFYQMEVNEKDHNPHMYSLNKLGDFQLVKLLS